MLDPKKIFVAAPVSGIAAAVANVTFFFITKSAGAFPETVLLPSSNEPLTALPVLIASFIPSLLAGAVLWLLHRFTKTPERIFTVTAIVLGLVSLQGPFGIPGATPLMIAVLEIMHVVAAVVITVGLLRLSKA